MSSMINCSIFSMRATTSLTRSPAGQRPDLAAMPSGSFPKPNSAWTVRSASWACSRATSTEILISLVVIIWMLMPFSARARNIRSATPGWVVVCAEFARSCGHFCGGLHTVGAGVRVAGERSQALGCGALVSGRGAFEGDSHRVPADLGYG